MIDHYVAFPSFRHCWSVTNNLATRGNMVDGAWIEDPKVVKNEFLSHFKERFNNPYASRLTLDMDFPYKLTIKQMHDLEQPFTKEEIKRAVWDCANVVDAANHFFNNGFCPKGGNSSFIALIPKTQGAKLVKDFRPISLIGSMYKIVAKILANRIVIVMGDLVNEVKYAFIANRQILDGPFILNEIIQWCKAKKKQTMIFKVDFEKAFDYVRLDFLDDVLKNFSFGVRWVIKVIHGEDGIDLLGSIKKNLGNEENTMFWEDTWKGEVPLKTLEFSVSSARNLIDDQTLEVLDQSCPDKGLDASQTLVG
ncbi:RNA-directed DNA polymerase, eukaryota, reverse transcriptase zinc-binding domain protein [Tanacetum coccineum]|uniref:RNA-directed DNA polymerase, eukaryota, reverse transcriptase zinc-binding domain protein n=1 Tax=Tanacetum coccineum TaxID=301880 RepID=A0ABQ4YTU1_9ASTR